MLIETIKIKNNAKIDFFIFKGKNIVSVEVKSEKSGRIRSLHYFLKAHPRVLIDLKVSEVTFGQHNNIEEISL